jgi:hypothetical protein
MTDLQLRHIRMLGEAKALVERDNRAHLGTAP